ncbi:ABC transporter permease [Enorma burkinafasonensis]|uniref:ABC transporter permease n=1 Tax=Enorma burkinafasonensis TaxID=2590867 RepID=UPI0011A6B834|nr:ABC transporter permease [Enorma burkinafasonensis]
MTTAFRKDIARTIRGNLKRFVSIAVICALGVAMFCGLRAACTDLRDAADAFFDDQRLFDIQVLSTLGLDDGDIAALATVDGVETVEGDWSETAYTDVDGARATVEVKARSSEGLNDPYLIEGELPEAADEVAVTQKFIDASGLGIGDTVEIAEAENEEEAVFARHPYRICGIVVDAMDVSNPELSFRSSSSADYTFIVAPEAIETDTYTVAYLTVEGADALPTYSDAYTERVEAVTDRIEDEIRADREAARTAADKDEAQAELDDARAEYEEERADAEAELADGWAELEDAARQLGDALREIMSGQAEIDDGWAEVRSGEADIASGRAELADGWAQFEQSTADARAQLEDALADGREQALEAARDQATAAAEAQVEQMRPMIEQQAVAAFEAQDQVKQAIAMRELLAAQLEPIEQQWGTLEALEAAIEQTSGNISAYTTAAQAIEELGGQIGGLRDQIGALDPASPSYAEDKAELEGQIETLEGQRDEHQAVIDQLDAQVGGLEALQAMLDEETRAAELWGQVNSIDELLEQGRQTAIDTAMDTALETALDQALPAAETQAEAAFAQIEEDSWREFDEGVAAGRAKLEQAEAELEAGAAALPAARQALIDAQAELDRGRAEYEDGMAAYLDGLAEWQDGRAEADEQFAEAEAELADAQAEIDAIDTATWYVQTRSSLSSWSSISSDADSIEAIGTLFPIVFLVVAMLVSLTTITRLVEEERGLIGTYKALGYRNGEILSKYLVYALSACIVGCLFGLFLGFIALPAFIFTIFDIMYLLPAYGFAFEALYGLGGTALFVVAIGATAYLACRSEVIRTPAELMRPKAPKSGSRIFLERIPAIWRRLSFLNKVTARNLFRYKRRFFMTVAGILGCTALIVCGFAIKDSVAELVPEQYGRISHYSILTATEAADHDGALRDIEADARVEEAVPIYIDSATLKYGEGEETVQLIVVPDGYAPSNEFSRFVSMTDRDTSASVDLPLEGAVITQNASEVLGFEAGDTVELQDSQLEQAELEVAHVARNYLGNYVYLTRSAYLDAFGDRASALDDEGAFQANGMLIRCTDAADAEASLAADLSDDSRFLSVTSTSELADDFSNSFMLINAVVAIVLGMAAALAFAVLFTLSTTNISERERELATIKVLGFRPREVHHYVNKETIILTIIGIVCGLPFGYVLGDVLLHALKMPSISFLTVVTPISYVLAAVLPLVFALVVNLITNRTLNRIDMIEALKSVE